MVIQAVSLYSESTIQSADSIEAHPQISGLFALGTYQVDQKADDSIEESKDEVPLSSSTSPEYSRKGSISLKKVERCTDGQVKCETLCTIETAAVLDMGWIPTNPSILSVALANSQLSLYRYNEINNETEDLSKPLEHLKKIQVNDKGALALSLDWSDRIGCTIGNCSKESISEPSVIVSQSDGSLSHISNIFNETIIETWKAHDYEVWTCAFDCWSNGNIIWSGGDDLTLKGWDLRMPCIDDQRDSTFVMKKGFEGGVTSMQSHHLRQHLWAVGSYDGGLRLFDARNTRRPISITQVGGGIWRTKWHPTKANLLLLGCMHDGFKVMSTTSHLDEELISSEMSIHTRFDEHKSLAYGCDWDASLNVIYSCSFYDATWHLWESQ